MKVGILLVLTILGLTAASIQFPHDQLTQTSYRSLPKHDISALETCDNNICRALCQRKGYLTGWCSQSACPGNICSCTCVRR